MGVSKVKTTGQHNILRTCRFLLAELKKQYKKKEFNGKKYDYLSAKESPEIRNYYNRVIQLAESIYKFAPIGIFFDLLLLEIAGAGNMDWLTVDGRINIKDKPNLLFPVSKIFKKLKQEFSNSNNINLEQFEKGASKNLFEKLRYKYRGIQREKNSKGYYSWSDEKRNSIYMSVQAFLVGYALYKDARFLEVAFNEFSGKEKMDWFDVNERGDLVIDHHIERVFQKYNPMIQLEQIAKLLKPDGYTQLINEVKDHIATKKFNRIKREYQRLDSQNLAKKILYKNISDLVKNCMSCYHACNKEEILLFMEEEVIRDVKFTKWTKLIFLPEGLMTINTTDALEANFDAVGYLGFVSKYKLKGSLTLNEYL